MSVAAGWVDLRCARHLWARLDPERGVIEVRCGRCDYPACGGFHYFDARTGEPLPDAEPRQHGAGDGESDREPEGGVLAPVAAGGAEAL